MGLGSYCLVILHLRVGCDSFWMKIRRKKCRVRQVCLYLTPLIYFNNNNKNMKEFFFQYFLPRLFYGFIFEDAYRAPTDYFFRLFIKNHIYEITQSLASQHGGNKILLDKSVARFCFWGFLSHSQICKFYSLGRHNALLYLK